MELNTVNFGDGLANPADEEFMRIRRGDIETPRVEFSGNDDLLVV